MIVSEEITPTVVRIRDTCNVYAVRSGPEAVLIDFGSGRALDELAAIGVERVTDVLLTHHHRDQAQGLAKAAAAGARIWVPPVEQELVAGVDRFWRRRRVENDYDTRQNRFSLLEPVPVAGTVAEYRARRYGAVELYALPTPGHTIGSVTYLLEADGRRLAFCGDLVYGHGQVWSLAATQWVYSGAAGLYANALSCGALAAREPDLLLPSHGERVDDPAGSLALARRRLVELGDMRLEQPYDLEAWEREPWVAVSPHLLRNRTSFATSYALLSDSGAALLFDWGFDQATGVDLPTDRAGRRPLLTSLEALRRDHGVERVETVLLTHYHDDHVAGVNLLREVEGTEVWAPEHVVPVLERPERHDLPCLWFDPVPVDRALAPGEPVRWHEYELTPYPLPGHTLYAAAYAFEVDGRLVLATGDQQSAADADGHAILNYQYRNRFRIDDYVASAELYRTLQPDLMLTGHWGVLAVSADFLNGLAEDGRRLAELHRELLPLGEVDFGAEGFGARIEPYRSSVAVGGSVELDVAVRNPFPRGERAEVRLVVPDGWRAEPESRALDLAPRGDGEARFTVVTGGPGDGRVAADLTVGEAPFGQQAEALVEARVVGSAEPPGSGGGGLPAPERET
jgi:glyoxylase-like metal-dependent hydrolase (beta-lactamase superfamily II)